MRKLLLLAFLCPFASWGAVIFPPASQAEVDAGVVANKFVSPKTLQAAALTNITATATNVKAGNMVIVDQVNGNDSTGARGKFNLSFQTVTNALAAAVAGDTIIVYPGRYTERLLLKHLVNQYWHNGAVLTNWSTVGGWGLFDDRLTGPVTCTIDGLGEFAWGIDGVTTPANATNGFGAIVTTNANTRLTVRGKTGLIWAPGFNGSSGMSFMSSMDGTNRLEIGSIVDPNYADNTGFGGGTEGGDGLYWERGDFIARVPFMRVEGYCLWSQRPAGKPFTTGNEVFLESDLLISDVLPVFYHVGANTNANWKTWIRAKNLYSESSLSAAIVLSAGGKFYLDSERIAITGGNGLAIDVDTGPVQAWINAQKVSATTGWFRNSQSNALVRLRVQEWEDIGAVENGFLFNGGTNLIEGGTATAAKVAVSHRAGKVIFSGTIIDTSAGSSITNLPVMVLSNGLTLRGVTLIAPSVASNSISAPTAQIVTIENGLTANKTNNSNITLQGDTFSVGTSTTLRLPTTTGTTGQVMTNDGTGILGWGTIAGGSGTPGGTDTQVQYNNVGGFGGSTKWTWTDSSASMVVTGANPVIRIFRPGLTTNEFTSASIISYGTSESIYPDNNSSLFYTFKSNVFNFSTPSGASSGNSVNPWSTNFANRYNVTGGQPTNTLLMIDAQSNINASAWSQSSSNLLPASGGPQNIGSNGVGRVATIFATNANAFNVTIPMTRIVTAGTISLGATSSNEMAYEMTTNANFTTSFSGSPENGKRISLAVSNNSANAVDLTVTSDAYFDIETAIDGTTTWTVKSNSIARMNWWFSTNFVPAGKWYGLKDGISLAVTNGTGIVLTTNSAQLIISVSTTLGNLSGTRAFTNIVSAVTNADFNSLLRSTNLDTIVLMTIGAGSGIFITNNGTNIMIAAAAGTGEANVNGEVSVTNATTMGLVYDKVSVTNRLRSLRGGNGIVLTNEGTNIVIAATAQSGSSNFVVSSHGNIDVTNQIQFRPVQFTGVTAATNIDFSLAMRWIMTNQLNTNMTLFLTNMADGKSAVVEIPANTLGTNFNIIVSVVAGGTTTTNIKWMSPTNGNFEFTAQSNATYYLSFVCDSTATATNIMASWSTTTGNPIRNFPAVTAAGSSASNTFDGGLLFKIVVSPAFTNLNNAIGTFTNGAQCIIGAHTLTNNFDSHITVWRGKFLAGTNSVKLIYGYDTVLASGSFTNADTAFEAGMEITRTGSVGAHADAWLRFAPISPALTVANDTGFYTNTELSCTNGTAVTNVIQFASNRSGSISNNFMRVTFEPGPR